jgi:hypothetical protein
MFSPVRDCPGGPCCLAGLRPSGGIEFIEEGCVVGEEVLPCTVPSGFAHGDFSQAGSETLRVFKSLNAIARLVDHLVQPSLDAIGSPLEIGASNSLVLANLGKLGQGT